MAGSEGVSSPGICWGYPLWPYSDRREGSPQAQVWVENVVTSRDERREALNSILKLGLRDFELELSKS